MIPATETARQPRRRAPPAKDASAAPKPARARKAAAGPRPIPAMPDFDVLSAIEAIEAMQAVAALAETKRRRSETPEHEFAVAEAAWRILIEGRRQKALGQALSGPECRTYEKLDDEIIDAADRLAARLLAMPPTLRQHLLAKRNVIEWWCDTDMGLEGGEEADAALLKAIDQAIAATALPEALPAQAATGDDAELVRLGADFLTAAETIAPLNNHAYVPLTPDNEEMDAPLGAAFDIGNRMATLKATGLASLAAKASAAYWHAVNWGSPLHDHSKCETYEKLLHSLAADLAALVGKPLPPFADGEA